MARDKAESKSEGIIQIQMLFFSYTEKWILKEGLNLNVIMPLLCISTEIKSQEDKSTAGQDIILEESLEGSDLK